MGAHNRYKKGDPVAMSPLPKGTILGADGAVVANVGEFAYSERPPEPDETVYVLKEAFAGPPGGHTLGLTLAVRHGWVFCTFQVPGGDKDDVGLVYLRGTTPPPEGTRFALRMLVPEEAQHATDAERQRERTAAEAGPVEAPPEEEGQAGAPSEARRLAAFPEAAAVLRREGREGGDDRRDGAGGAGR